MKTKMYDPEFDPEMDGPSTEEAVIPPKAPARMRFYPFARDLYKNYYAQFKDQAETKLGKTPTSGFLPFTKGVAEPLDLPSIGCDAAELSSMYYDNFTETGEEQEHQRPNHRSHDALRIILGLHQDGSPYVAEGDALGLSGFENTYAVLLSREMPPFMVQHDSMEDFSRGSLEQARRVNLTDEECERLMEFIGERKVDIDDPIFDYQNEGDTWVPASREG